MPILAPNFFICVPILDLSDARTVRLRALFEDPTTELHLMFMSLFLINLTRPNLFLQQAEPQIHHVFETIHTTVQNILRRFARVKEVDEYDVDDMIWNPYLVRNKHLIMLVHQLPHPNLTQSPETKYCVCMFS